MRSEIIMSVAIKCLTAKGPKWKIKEIKTAVPCNVTVTDLDLIKRECESNKALGEIVDYKILETKFILKKD